MSDQSELGSATEDCLEPESVLVADRTSGVSIISDGTEEGTAIYVDGCRVEGLISARWAFNTKDNKAKVILEIEGASIDTHVTETPEVRAAVQSVTPNAKPLSLRARSSAS